MMLVLSGEGPTDLGAVNGSVFSVGPLAVVVDKLLERVLGYRPLQLNPAGVHFISKSRIDQRARDGAKRKGFAFVGKKRGQETAFCYIAAWMLGEMALALEDEQDDRSIAVLHRDSDDRSSTAADLWGRKFQSMLDGFARAGFARGVPMLPRPISESWLLCAARPELLSCALLECESASAKAPRPLKQQLNEALSAHLGADALADWIEGVFDPAQLDKMPSFARFHQKLDDAAASVLAG